ncbi:MAG: allantoinase AllB [Caldisericaceae bacterium]
MIRIKNGFLVKQENELEKATIYIEDGKINSIFPFEHTSTQVEKEIDAHNAIIMPGFIDPHVHFDDPGYTQREDFETGTRSAAAGGITTVIDMPCTSVPPVTTAENFDNKLNIVSVKAYVDFAFWGGVTPSQVESGEYLTSLRDLHQRGIVGVKFYTISGMDTYPRMPVPLMDKAFRLLKDLNVVCAVHSEDFYLVDYYTQYLRSLGRKDPASWPEARVYGAEPVAIWTVASIAEKVGNKLHIVHLSSKAGLNVIEWAKSRQIDITTETCPHYLLFVSQDYVRLGPILKTAPPVRYEEDRDALWEGLKKGIISFVASDHAAAQYPKEKSSEDFFENYAGIPGTQLMAPILLNFGFHSSKLTLSKIQELLSTNAAKRYGLYPKKGSLAIGSDADLVFIDPDEEWTVQAELLESKGKYSVIDRQKLVGKVKKTFVRGELVFDDSVGVVGKRGYGRYVKSAL